MSNLFLSNRLGKNEVTKYKKRYFFLKYNFVEYFYKKTVLRKLAC